MAYLFIDSFDHSNVVTTGGKWASESGTGVDTSVVRTGTRALIITGGSRFAVSRTFAPASITALLGVAFRQSTLGVAGDFLRIREGATTHVALAFGTAGELVIKRGSTTLATSAAGILSINSWFYIALGTTIHDTTGTYTVLVDGIPVLTATGVDTRNGGTGQFDSFSVHSPDGSTWFDDLYFFDSSGSRCNTLLADARVTNLLPSTGNGTYTGFTPSSGVDHGAMVDEVVPDGDSTYNQGTAAGDKDSYNYPVLGSSDPILAVQTCLYQRKTDAGAREVAALLRSGGADFNGATISPTTSYLYQLDGFEVDPATGVPWIESGVNALEVGMEVIT